MTSTATEIKMRLVLAKAARDEALVKSLLGRWVSEFEPSLAIHGGEIIGLCVKDDPSGSIPVRVNDWRPFLSHLARAAGFDYYVPDVEFARRDLGFD